MLWAGTLTFWSLIWPRGHGDRRLFSVALAGAGLLMVATVAEPLIRLGLGSERLAEFAPPLAGAAVLVRLAILVASVFFLVDLISAAVTGGRRVMAIGAVIVVAATMAIQPSADGELGHRARHPGRGGLPTGHCRLARRAGGLALVLRPGGGARPADGVLTRFSPVAMLSLVVLLVIGAGASLATSGGPDGQGDLRFWLSSGGHARFPRCVAGSGQPVSPIRGPGCVPPAVPAAVRRLRTVPTRGLTLVFGMELAVAFAVLTATGMLMMVAQVWLRSPVREAEAGTPARGYGRYATAPLPAGAEVSSVRPAAGASAKRTERGIGGSSTATP